MFVWRAIGDAKHDLRFPAPGDIDAGNVNRKPGLLEVLPEGTMTRLGFLPPFRFREIPYFMVSLFRGFRGILRQGRWN
jgi:hypothetical protein